MGKTVHYTLNEETIYYPTDEEWQRIDELARRGGEAYYADIPELDDEFLAHAEVPDQYPKRRRVRDVAST